MDWIEKAAAECAFGINLAELDFPMQEKVFAAIIRRHYEAAAKCKACGGTGTEGLSRNECKACRGEGEVVPNA